MTLPTLDWFCKTVGATCPAAVAGAPLGLLCYDSRKLQTGDTFLAVVGERDGHDYVQGALASGAKTAIVARAWASANPAARASCIVVDDTLAALQHAAAEWRTLLRGAVIGITGSNGKTSTKDILLKLLATHYVVAGTAGNLNNHLGVPLTLLATPIETQISVIELGASRAGEIGELCRIAQPTHGLVTSIGRAHMAGFGSIASVAQTKGQLYDAVAEQGVAFVHTDDELCRIQASDCRTQVGYGFSERNGVWSGPYFGAHNLGTNATGGVRFRLQDLDFELEIPGFPAALAALAGLAVAATFEIPLSACAAIVREWNGVSGRMHVEQIGDLRILDDSYNANPASMRAALHTLLTFDGRKVAVLGTMAELGGYSDEEHQRLVDELATLPLHRIVLVGPEWGAARALLAARGIEAIELATVEDGLTMVDAITQDAQIVLIKGSRSAQLDRLAALLRERTS